jgi:hypothetical protein
VLVYRAATVIMQLLRRVRCARLGLEASVNDEALAEASAEYFDGGREWLAPRVRTPDQEYITDEAERLQRMRQASRGRRLAASSASEPKPARNRVHFSQRGWS